MLSEVFFAFWKDFFKVFSFSAFFWGNLQRFCNALFGIIVPTNYQK